MFPRRLAGEIPFPQTSHPKSCVFSPDGLYVVTGSADGFIEVWDFETCKFPKVRPCNGMDVRGIQGGSGGGGGGAAAAAAAAAGWVGDVCAYALLCVCQPSEATERVPQPYIHAYVWTCISDRHLCVCVRVCVCVHCGTIHSLPVRVLAGPDVSARGPSDAALRRRCAEPVLLQRLHHVGVGKSGK